MKRFIIAISLVIPALAIADQGAQVTNELGLSPELSVCAHVLPIESVPGGEVLYKAENIHGGRGPTFLVQNVGERTGKARLEIRNARCEVIGAFGLFATDEPYGARYYSRTGGSGHSSEELLALANQVGSNNILIEGKDNRWIRVRNPMNREGHIRK